MPRFVSYSLVQASEIPLPRPVLLCFALMFSLQNSPSLDIVLYLAFKAAVSASLLDDSLSDASLPEDSSPVEVLWVRMAMLGAALVLGLELIDVLVPSMDRRPPRVPT
ncbi:hypothetical protein B0I35DRAFT_415032 [Stachybotrys elegans]|uniref:Uncharacterized protein n=1 Tax=Stachybotrys elegans TaxID=80388 RepID=A0A8K0S8Q0_9HYPO|nr:hypothetical protein B0I35DRAFT_415032 [Stachybotrys elegans]